MYPSRPGVCLSIVVVGGGIAGISTAYALGKAGHNVTVVDKGDGNPDAPRAIRSGPNMTKILRQWGLASTLERISDLCERIDWYSRYMNVPLGSMVLTQDVFRDFEADWQLMEQAELWFALKNLAEEAGVVFRFKTGVSHVDSATGYVYLQDGEQIYGDIIIGADGYNSHLRSLVTGEEERQGSEAKYLILSFTLHTDILQEDHDLKALVEKPFVLSMWIGERYIVQGNCLHKGRDYTVTIQYKCDGNLEIPAQGDWKAISAAVSASGGNFDNFDTRIRKLLSYATAISSTTSLATSPPDTLVCENSRIILVGEAAHPTMPGVHHSQPLSFEDADVLGNLFSRIQHKDQVSRLLTAYNEIRQPWSKFAVDYIYTNHIVLEAEPGPFQEARDAKIQAMMVQIAGDHIDEELLQEMWGNELILFAYDAGERVEDWWGQYGSFITRSPHRDSLVSSIAVSVSEGSV